MMDDKGHRLDNMRGNRKFARIALSTGIIAGLAVALFVNYFSLGFGSSASAPLLTKTAVGVFLLVFPFAYLALWFQKWFRRKINEGDNRLEGGKCKY